MAELFRNPLSDPVRGLSALSALGRIAIGIGLALAPERSLSALGFSDHSTGTITISRIAGGRDIVLGALTLLALDDDERLRTASFANAAVDGGDALAFAAALRRDGAAREAGVRGLAAAVPATLTSLWAANRLTAAS
jgi:hypothetical protein